MPLSMPSLEDYLFLAADNEKKKEELRRQWAQATAPGRVINCCDCKCARSLEHAYRCLYCGLYLCAVCGEIHFGESIREYHERTHNPRCTTTTPNRQGVQPTSEPRLADRAKSAEGSEPIASPSSSPT